MMKSTRELPPHTLTSPTPVGGKPKEFRWMGFKSHMMATMAKWRELNYLTDAIFQCFDGQVFAHRLILAAASPLLEEIMSQDQAEDVVIFVPEVSSSVMTAIIDLLYKGRMNITPSSTYAIRSLVQILQINADDVSVISGAKNPLPSVINNSNALASPGPTNETSRRTPASGRKRRSENSAATPTLKIAKMSPVQENNRGSKRKSKKHKAMEASASSDAEPTGFHDLEDVETWVCAICQCYDPVITSPLKNPQQSEMLMTTEWIGCDCNRWYHKYCTKLKHIDDSFSCKQLNRQCLPLS